MAQSLFLQEIVRTITQSHEACDRAWSELAEIKVAARKSIIESRELMAKLDAVLNKR